MKKKLLAALCALALLLGGLSFSAFGAPSTIYLLAANDKMCDLPGNALPIAVNGTIYVPYTVFDKDATGADLGVYYGIRQDRGIILNLYSLSGNLTFNVAQSKCTDRDGNEMNFRAVIRNGIPYVPAAAVCSFFGLQYSFLPTSNPERGTLIRICSSSASLSDSVFLSAATTAMLSRYNTILQSMEPQPTPTAAPTATPTPTTPPPVTSNPPPSKEHVRVYLAVDATEASQDLTPLFGSTYVLFLFTPDSLAAQSDLVRSAVGAGHSIGLIVSGTPEEAREQLAAGNDLLTHIARTRTRIVSAPRELTDGLEAEGWSCWQPNVSGSNAATLLANLDRRSYGRLTLPANAYTIDQVLTQLRADRYTLRQPFETNL